MASFHASVVTLVFLFILSLLSLTTTAAPTYVYHFCTNASTYTPNSTYQANLNLLLSSLSSNATRDNGFYNSTVGRNSPDIAYGLFLCRGDGSTDVCRDCVTTASRELVERCPNQKVAIIWYDECLLRYSNGYIFATVAQDPRVSLLNEQNATEQDRLNQLVQDTMADAATLAVRNDQSPGKKFATATANFTSLQTLYTLVQCTPDLSPSDCNRCLSIAIAGLPGCCSGKLGGRVLLPSCNVRYDLYPFYNVTATTPPAPPLAPSTRGKEKFSSQKIIAIVVPIAVCVVLFFILCHCFLRREARKKYNAIKQENAFFARSRTELDMPMKGLESEKSTSKSMPWSVNEASITELEPR
ncbi:hypothetical protein L1049_007347 [Liquidambar formosana]|uniref:Gnk2-homologous domain-containing protein n=1 Tax=Liquidambar formosana TaxID=63359 RepID=A0AAP0N559_LIQFO